MMILKNRIDFDDLEGFMVAMEEVFEEKFEEKFKMLNRRNEVGDDVFEVKVII